MVLVTSVVLGAGPSLLPGLNARASHGLVGCARFLAWLAVALFSYFLWKARRDQAGILQQVRQDRRSL